MRNVARGLAVMGFVATMLATSAARATEPFASVRYGATFVGFPVGVRNIGMGATGTADASNLVSGYFNPASLAFVDATTLVSSHEEMLLDLSLSDVLISSPIPFHSDSTASAWHFGGALGYTLLNFPTQEERTVFLPEGTGRTIDLDEWMLSGTGAASWSHSVMELAAGGTAKFIQPSTDITLWAFDVGVVAAFPIDLDGGRLRPRLGYSALNLDWGASGDDFDMYVPSEQRAGFGFDLEAPSTLAWGRSVPAFSFSLDYDRINPEGNSDRDFAAGVELSIIDFMHLRYGAMADDFATYGLGLGWDYGNVLFRVDYAHAEPRDKALENLLGFDLERDTVGALIGVRW